MNLGKAWLSVAIVLSVLLTVFVSQQATADEAKIKVLILDGRNNHEWEKTTPALKEMLEATGRFAVDVHTAPPPVEGKPDQWPLRLGANDMAPYDCLLSNYNGPRWSPDMEKAFLAYVESGKGFALVHAANNCHRAWKEYDEMLGYNWRGSAHGPKFPYDVNITDTKHPITEGLTDFWHNKDELYHALKLNPKSTNLRVLARSFSPPRMLRLKRQRPDGTEYVIDHCFGTGNDEPVVVITDYGRGRCFHMILGHYAESMEDNGFKTLMTRGVEWAATGKVTLPVIQPIPPAKNLPRYPQPQVVVEGLEQHLWHKEFDRLAELFAGDVEAMTKSATENSEPIQELIRNLRIPRVKWQVEGERASWTLPDHKEGSRWWRIECVKQGPDWKIAKIE